MSRRGGLDTRIIDGVVDRGWLPDPVLRAVIRLLLLRRRAQITRGGLEARSERTRQLIEQLAAGPVTLAVDAANEQHYEVPTAWFRTVLGPHLKYSSGWWPPGVDDLGTAEAAMLRLTAERARIEDGQRILELGCGWGSLTLWLAEHYPAASIVGVSNSATQRRHIEAEAARRGLANLTVLTADVAVLGTGGGSGGGDGEHAEVVRDGAFDRVVSVELFEHVRNHRELTRRIARWLAPGGMLFVHVFAHRSDPYVFASGVRADWMARNFFTGGIMPSHDLLARTVKDLVLDDQWAVSGEHYARTLRAWLERIDADREHLLEVLAGDDPRAARARLHRWRVFTIACEELFAFADGDEWHVSHHRFIRPA